MPSVFQNKQEGFKIILSKYNGKHLTKGYEWISQNKDLHVAGGFGATADKCTNLREDTGA